MDEEIYAIICSNIRVADQRIGDVKAVAALMGADRPTFFWAAMATTRWPRRSPSCAAASAQMRQMIATMPEEAGSRCLCRQRRRGRRAARDQARHHQVDNRLRFDFDVEPLLRADEFGSATTLSWSSGHAAHLPGVDQRRRVRAAGYHRL